MVCMQSMTQTFAGARSLKTFAGLAGRSKTLEDIPAAPVSPAAQQQQHQQQAADPSVSANPSVRTRAAAPRLRVYPDVDVADLLDQMPGNGCAASTTPEP